MANVIDVSSSGEPEAAVLTRTAKSGLLGGTYLQSQPLAEYLGDGEVAHYVLRNKKSGVRIEHAANGTEAPPETAPEEATSGESASVEELTPSSEYQALAAITDVRIVFVVGTADGDRSVSLPLSDVAVVSVESGILGSELSITTAADDRYTFPCRGDLEPIGEFVDRGAQAWARAYTLVGAAREALGRAERHRADETFDEAIDAIAEAVDAVADARARIVEFGEGAANALEPETEELSRTLAQRRREIHAEHGVHAHERARTHWGNREYERAHDAYLVARRALARAQELEATGGIEDRLERIDDDLEDLADAPISYASAMVEEAEASDDARTSAQCWAVAIERYRDVYALDWASDIERFNGDPDTIRDRILSAIDRLVEHRVAAAEDLRTEAQWLRESGDGTDARTLLEETLESLERTEALVAELSHAEYPELAAARAETEAALSRTPPTAGDAVPEES